MAKILNIISNYAVCWALITNSLGLLGFRLDPNQKSMPHVFRAQQKNMVSKVSRAFADLRYGEEDSISPNTLTFPATKG